MSNATETSVRCRLDGLLEGVHGPVCAVAVDPTVIVQTMGWQENGRAQEVIAQTMALLRQGHAVQLKSHYGYCIFSPLAPGETGLQIPASQNAGVCAPDGSVVRGAVQA
jgi:hypothetical protein